MTNRLLKGCEVAALLNISRTQAYILMQRGDIPTVRFGKLVRVRPEDLETFIGNNIFHEGLAPKTSEQRSGRD